MPFVFTDRKILLNPCRDGDLWGFKETATIPPSEWWGSWLDYGRIVSASQRFGSSWASEG
jgi:hypothetical protein